MKLELRRKEFTEESTIGDLYINDSFFCFTLEDKVRKGEKVYGKTAIPYGNYKVVIDYSTRFQRDMPHILDVSGFQGVRIHSGNTAASTEGCVLLGFTKDKDFIGQSKLAFAAFFERLKVGVKQGDVILEIKEA